MFGFVAYLPYDLEPENSAATWDQNPFAACGEQSQRKCDLARA